MTMYWRGRFVNFNSGGSLRVKNEVWLETIARFKGRIAQLERPAHHNGWVGRIYLHEHHADAG